MMKEGGRNGKLLGWGLIVLPFGGGRRVGPLRLRISRASFNTLPKGYPNLVLHCTFLVTLPLPLNTPLKLSSLFALLLYSVKFCICIALARYHLAECHHACRLLAAVERALMTDGLPTSTMMQVQVTWAFHRPGHTRSRVTTVTATMTTTISVAAVANMTCISQSYGYGCSLAPNSSSAVTSVGTITCGRTRHRRPASQSLFTTTLLTTLLQKSSLPFLVPNFLVDLMHLEFVKSKFTTRTRFY